MHDPFPLAAWPAVASFVDRWVGRTSSVGLTTLHLHVHEIVYGFLLYHLIFKVIAPAASRILVPGRYAALTADNRLRWNMKVVSFVQSSLICAMSVWTMRNDTERAAMGLEQRVWGYTGAAGLVQAFAVAYFLWDSYVMIRYTRIFGPAMLVHGIACTFVYGLGFRPFLNYYGCVFMLYELSTPFVNIHWALDKIGMTGSKLQVANGVTLILVFFSARIAYGWYMSAKMYTDVLTARGLDCSKVELLSGVMSDGNCPLPTWLLLVYLGAHVTLNSLNVYWFRAMINAIRRRAEYKPKDA